jgi:signal recognition particle receptor subunit beta
MVLLNYANRELTAKIVYYGPGLCGKTTNLEFIHKSIPQKTRGKMLALATKTDRTLFFDFLPLELGSIGGMKTKIQLYTVPGQVFYDATRKLVLKGADGVVFVADSQKEMMESNLDSWENFKTNLKENGLDIHTIPLVIQYNKRDLPNVLPIKELNRRLNEFKSPHFEAVAVSGQGVQDTLKGITKLVMESLSKRYKPKKSLEQPAPATAPAPAPKMEKQLPSVEQVVKAAMEQVQKQTQLSVPVPVVEAQPTPMAVQPVALDVSAEEYEELEEISELSPEPEPLVKPAMKMPAATVAAHAGPEPVAELLDSSQEIFADDSGPQEKVIQFESTAGRTQDVSVPIEVRVGPPGEEVKLQIVFELKIKVLPK